MQKLIKETEGYKIFNDDLTCRGFQFELGKINELDNNKPLELCKNGFHFCKHPSGVWSYYNTGRVFKVRAYDVLELPETAGAAFKLVCRKIELLDEIKPDGNYNTGNYNTGNYNTGNRNTGNRNTGNRNTGNRNTGDYNTGDGNTGDRNTGNYNTGDRNTGNFNTGDRNTGNRNTGNYNTGDYNTGSFNTGNFNTGNHNTGNFNTGNYNTGNYNTGNRNTGDRNTGNRNTGNYNTGDYNTGDYNTGSFNTGSFNTGSFNTGNGWSGSLNLGEAPFYLFNEVADKSKVNFNLVRELYDLILRPEPIDPTPFLTLPNATENKIKALHAATLKARGIK